jgi:hypothetical protein
VLQEAAIRSMQGSLQQMWELDGEIFKREIGQDMTYDDLAYAMSLVSQLPGCDSCWQ